MSIRILIILTLLISCTDKNEIKVINSKLCRLPSTKLNNTVGNRYEFTTIDNNGKMKHTVLPKDSVYLIYQEGQNNCKYFIEDNKVLKKAIIRIDSVKMKFFLSEH